MKIKDLYGNPEGFMPMLVQLGYEGVQANYVFSESRGFHFDYAWPDHKFAIEVDGIFGTRQCPACKRGFSKHSTVDGLARDKQKLMLATIEGWTLIQLLPQWLDTMLFHVLDTFLKQGRTRLLARDELSEMIRSKKLDLKKGKKK